MSEVDDLIGDLTMDSSRPSWAALLCFLGVQLQVLARHEAVSVVSEGIGCRYFFGSFTSLRACVTLTVPLRYAAHTDWCVPSECIYW